MTEMIVLLMLLGWLACTLIMTLRAGHAGPEHTERRESRHVTEPPASLASGEMRDSALVSRP